MVSQGEVPAALVVTGVVVLIIGIVNALLSSPFEAADVIPDAVASGSLFACAYALHRWNPVDTVVSWTYAGAMSVVVGWLLNEFRFQPDTANMAYVVIVLATFGPLTLAWVPFLTASLVMSVASLGVLVASGWGDARGWAAAYVVAVGVGTVMLWLRMRSLVELSRARATADRLATADPVTGVLNGHGLELMSAVLVSSAKRHGQPLVVWCVEVGSGAGESDRDVPAPAERLLIDVARALTEVTREGDLVARLSAREFVVVGLGIEPASDPLLMRVLRQLRPDARGADLVGVIRAGSASRMPQVATVSRLIEEARSSLRVAHELVRM
jgi:GGDEF domain-containing protein